jgi:YD repeat-containing protein
MATADTALLDAETFSVSSQRDALGRVLAAVSPDGSEVHYSYDGSREGACEQGPRGKKGKGNDEE